MRKTLLAVLALCALTLAWPFARTQAEEDNEGSFAKRRAEVPIDWKEVELLVIESPHDSFETELKARNYPYYTFSHGDIKRFLEAGGASATYYDENGKKSQRKIPLLPRKQVIMFGCSNFITPMKDPDIYRFRRFLSEGGFIFTNCWGAMLLGQTLPDYVKVEIQNSNPPSDINGSEACDLVIDPTKHDLFLGLEDMEKTVTFEFSGARIADPLTKDIETLFKVRKAGVPAMLHFQFKADPKKWDEPYSGVPAGTTSGEADDQEPKFYGEVLNFLPHFVEQRNADPKIADIRDTIFFNFIVRKQGLSKTMKELKKK